MDRSKCKVLICQDRTLMNFKDFTKLESELGFKATAWVHANLRLFLGPDYSVTRLGKSYDTVDNVSIDEFVATNEAGKTLTIKVINNEIPEFD